MLPFKLIPLPGISDTVMDFLGYIKVGHQIHATVQTHPSLWYIGHCHGLFGVYKRRASDQYYCSDASLSVVYMAPCYKVIVVQIDMNNL